MTARAAIIRAGLLSLVPVLLVLVIGGTLISLGFSASGRAMLLGGAIAAPLALGGAALIAAFARAPLPIALFAALAAFGIRILGAGIALVFIPGLTQAGITAVALIGVLVAALAIEMYGLARSTMIQEPVRA